MSTITVQIQGLAEFQANIAGASAGMDGEIRTAMVQSTNTVKNTAQQLAPYKTGTLRRSIFTQVDSPFRGIIGQDVNMASYGPLVEGGTAAHLILPVNKKALFWKGALNPYKAVHHPGTRAQPFMAPALTQNIENITRFFSQAIGKVVHRMAGKGGL